MTDLPSMVSGIISDPEAASSQSVIITLAPLASYEKGKRVVVEVDVLKVYDVLVDVLVDVLNVLVLVVVVIVIKTTGNPPKGLVNPVAPAST